MLRRGFLVYFSLSLVAIAVIVGLTAERKTWSNLIGFDFRYLLLIFGVIFLRWYFDGLSLRALVNNNPRAQLGTRRAVEIRLEGVFASATLPVLLGSTAFQTYLLHRERIPVGESAAISSIRAILPIFLFVVGIPGLFLIGFQNEGNQFFVKFIKIAILPILLSLFFFILALFLPGWIKGIAAGVIRALLKMRVIGKEKIYRIETRVFDEIDTLSAILRHYLRRGRLGVLEAMVYIVISFVAEFGIAILLLRGFGINPPVIRALVVQFFLRSILYFAPSPGGSGFNEFGYMGFFSLYAPHFLVGISVFLWRLLTAYLPIFAGGTILIWRVKKG